MYGTLSFDYSAAGMPRKLFKSSTGGAIKEELDDFNVDEIPAEKNHVENGEYTYFTLTKRNWTTMAAIAKIAKLCHVSWKRFKFAGTKDRFGTSSQQVCVVGIGQEFLSKLKIKDIELSNFFASDEPLQLGELVGNRFTVTVRNYECKDVKKVVESFVEFAKKGLPNYFGEQRFGLQRPNNHIIGRMILKEDYENAMKELLAKSYPLEGGESSKARKFLEENWGDWAKAIEVFPKYLNVERIILMHLANHKNDYINAMRKLPKNIAKIFVYSYQSYIFNKALSKMIERGLLADFEMELPGYDSKLDKLGGSVVEEIMKDEGVSLSDFRVSSYPEISCRGALRRTVFYPEQFELKSVKKDSYTVSFALPKSCYATVLLRELVSVE